MTRKRKKDIQSEQELLGIQKESEVQSLPKQEAVFSVSSKIRKRVRNLPDPARPPLGYDEHKAFDRVFPYIRLPRFHPPGNEDTVIFNAPQLPANQLILGDNLEVLRTLPSNSIDLIYIDPPFFSGRQYNVIWGDTNEVRTFYDIWEGGIDSYLIWLNARLWEMRRVLKPTGSIYVHCDWHASHYIKCEMDKIFGYENFRNEIVWSYRTGGISKNWYSRKHDVILFYSKSSNYKFFPQKEKVYLEAYGIGTQQGEWARKVGIKLDENNKPYRYTNYRDVWEVNPLFNASFERIGYPTQKPIELMQIIIETSSEPGDIVADFFCGGGSFLVAAMGARVERIKGELPKTVFYGNRSRRFIGCDSSRVAISVTLDRLVKIGEEMSGVKSNISTGDKPLEEKLQMKGIVEKVPNIEVYYHGVYPIEKFKNLDRESFIKFVLTCYGASRNTAEGITHGYRPPRQQEPILVGPPDPTMSIDAQEVKAFFDEIKARLEPNKLVKAKIIGWRFSRQVVEYIKILRRYIEDNNLPMEIDLIPLDSKEFRARILQRYPDAEEGEFFLRFSKSPVIGDIRVKRIGPLEYEFEAIDALSTNEDGYLVNCQWDFDYQEGHFAAHKDYILSRRKVKIKGKGERFEAILTAKHKFEREGEYTIACKVQDNLAGEAILAKKVKIE
jgi:DNA modification methylase